MSPSTMRPWRKAALGLALCLAACAETPPPTTTAPAPAAALEPEASAALRRMSATLTGAAAFTLRVNTLREAPAAPGQTILLSGTTAIAIRRPDRLYASTGSDLGSFNLWYDGRSFTALNTHQNIFASEALTGPLEPALHAVQERLGVALPILPLFAADPYATLTPPGTTGRRIGRSIIRDVVVEHFALNGPNGHWEIWLEAAASGLPLRVSYVEPGPERLRVILDFETWDLRPRLPESTFAFTPPPDAARASFLPPGQSPAAAALTRRTTP
ncbi:DUF2092 domain-containing protein [Sediminicoccus sp. KRV36]|uniref:DUF2092 domain-containing protein n=1 Tax=Sediminicoccus sp. KRV36 TaxID=3133721 RepID=UPI002010802A|nr:DUF2092 domain-containing protein [Sediminicoccus rosea]UPY38556.1 DUF2092 domain-containing protein [Sediminicoccus rosea]